MPIEYVTGLEDCVCRHPELVNLYSCTIGAGTKIGAFVEIGRGVQIGKRCKIQSFVFIPEGVTIEDDVFIGPGVVFCNVRRPDPRKPALIKEGALVESGVVIGARAVILPGVTIHTDAFIGAGSVVTRDVAPGVTVCGNPARKMVGKYDWKSDMASRKIEANCGCKKATESIRRILEAAPRSGADKDEPEGSRVVILSETLVDEMLLSMKSPGEPGK